MDNKNPQVRPQVKTINPRSIDRYWSKVQQEWGAPQPKTVPVKGQNR